MLRSISNTQIYPLTQKQIIKKLQTKTKPHQKSNVPRLTTQPHELSVAKPYYYLTHQLAPHIKRQKLYRYTTEISEIHRQRKSHQNISTIPQNTRQVINITKKNQKNLHKRALTRLNFDKKTEFKDPTLCLDNKIDRYDKKQSVMRDSANIQPLLEEIQPSDKFSSQDESSQQNKELQDLINYLMEESNKNSQNTFPNQSKQFESKLNQKQKKIEDQQNQKKISDIDFAKLFPTGNIRKLEKRLKSLMTTDYNKQRISKQISKQISNLAENIKNQRKRLRLEAKKNHNRFTVCDDRLLTSKFNFQNQIRKRSLNKINISKQILRNKKISSPAIFKNQRYKNRRDSYGINETINTQTLSEESFSSSNDQQKYKFQEQFSTKMYKKNKRFSEVPKNHFKYLSNRLSNNIKQRVSLQAGKFNFFIKQNQRKLSQTKLPEIRCSTVRNKRESVLSNQKINKSKSSSKYQNNIYQIPRVGSSVKKYKKIKLGSGLKFIDSKQVNKIKQQIQNLKKKKVRKATKNIKSRTQITEELQQQSQEITIPTNSIQNIQNIYQNDILKQLAIQNIRERIQKCSMQKWNLQETREQIRNLLDDHLYSRIFSDIKSQFLSHLQKVEKVQKLLLMSCTYRGQKYEKENVDVDEEDYETVFQRQIQVFQVNVNKVKMGNFLYDSYFQSQVYRKIEFMNKQQEYNFQITEHQIQQTVQPIKQSDKLDQKGLQAFVNLSTLKVRLN